MTRAFPSWRTPTATAPCAPRWLPGSTRSSTGPICSPETRSQLAESHAVWVPTLVTIGNLIGDGRFPDAALRPLLAFQQQAVRDAAAQGARIACGSDAGAYRVLHAQGGLDEQALLRRTLGPTADQILTQGNTEIQKRF